MGPFFRKHIQVGERAALNLSKSTFSVTEMVWPLSLNFQGRVTLRPAPGPAFRFTGKHRR
jgi:hypothetical protein